MLFLLALGVLFGPPVTALASGLLCGLVRRNDTPTLPFSRFPVVTGLATGLVVGIVGVSLNIAIVIMAYFRKTSANNFTSGELAFAGVVAIVTTIGAPVVTYLLGELLIVGRQHETQEDPTDHSRWRRPVSPPAEDATCI